MSGRRARQRRRETARRRRPITADQLRDGLPGPEVYSIRAVRPDEWPAVRDLLELAHVEAEPALLEAIRSSLIGDVVLRDLGKSTDDGLRALAEHFMRGGVREAMAASGLVLVCTHPDHSDPVGAVVSNPPGAAMAHFMKYGASRQDMIMLIMAITKIPALAVAIEHRGAGVGKALLHAATRVAHQRGATHVYGQVRMSDQLADWYRRCGFTVLPAGRGLDLEWLLHKPFGIKPMPNEQLFVSTRHEPATPALPPAVRGHGR